MTEFANIVGAVVVEQGIWKFAFTWIFFAFGLIYQFFTKVENEDLGSKALNYATIMMFTVTSFFLALGIYQLIL